MKRIIIIFFITLISFNTSAMDTNSDASKAYEDKKYSEAVNIFKSLALNGDQEAQYNLGSIYFEGKAVERDYVEAAKWFTLAAKQGNAKAQSKLGAMYENGHGVEKDFIKALKFYRLAAAQEKAKLQNNHSNESRQMQNLLYLYAGILISVFLAGKNKGGRIELVAISILSLFFISLAMSFPADSQLRFLFIFGFIIPSFSIARRLNTLGLNKWSALWCFTGIYSFYKTCELIFNTNLNNERRAEIEKKTYSATYYIESLYGFILGLIILIMIIGLVFLKLIR